VSDFVAAAFAGIHHPAVSRRLLSFAGQSVVPVLVALTIVVMPVAFAGGALVALDILGLAPPAARRAPAMMP